MKLGARIIVQHVTDFFVIWLNFSEVGRISSVKRISPDLLNFSVAIHCRAWIVPGNGKVVFLMSSTERAGEIFQPATSSGWHQLEYSWTHQLHIFHTETLQHALQPLGFRGRLASTELRTSSCFSVVPSLLDISYTWSSEKQDADRRHGLEVKWNVYVLLILTELEVFILWFCDPSSKSGHVWAGCVERSLRVRLLLCVWETRLLKSSSFWKYSWSLSLFAWADKLSSNFIWFCSNSFSLVTMFWSSLENSLNYKGLWELLQTSAA